ncbi:MAG: triphosphoribosyl-dephospho-CoA synthase [Desulfosporosinus sp.]|nr:triphosphoribosyl-dephospho-CoA synthase [Desulfosporosinus sp.]
MPKADFRWDIARAAQVACIMEASAPKVGNVNRRHDFSDCLLEDFQLSAVAIGEPLGRVKAQGVGKTVLAAIQATRRVVPTNTNLGIVLLLAPLAMAWSRLETGEKTVAGEKTSEPRESWLREMTDVLTGLTAEDTRYVYEAIRLANPGGIGQAQEHDVNLETCPEITLLEAMRLASDRDLVAREYVNRFHTVFEVGLPVLEGGLKAGMPLPLAVAETHLFILSQFPDTLIARKVGISLSQEVQVRAQRVWEKGGFRTEAGRAQTAAFDAWLREGGHPLNPGATADITAAILFVLFLENGLEYWGKTRMGSLTGFSEGNSLPS